jgi:hypothetical protein
MARGRRERQSESESPALPDDITIPPFETAQLRKKIKEFMDKKIEVGEVKIRLGSCKFGVYAFFDYDDEPIYVGQTCENLRGRIGRHLTGQRSDAVGKNVLDPFEVYAIEVWPLFELQSTPASDRNARVHLNDLEFSVFQTVLTNSKFNAVLNEKEPTPANLVTLPQSFRGIIVSDEVRKFRAHPDIRIARRAATLARLAQVISEREVNQGLRKALVVQANRLQWLAERRYEHFVGLEDASAMNETNDDES